MSSRRAGMGSHHSARMETDVWLTPPALLRKLGPFDLDPCAPCERDRPWATADRHFCRHDDGLRQFWEGRVWMNPPYGRQAAVWLRKLCMHGSGTALIFARTETEMWHDWVWPCATAVLFLKGRLHFHRADGSRAPHNAGAPSALVAYGQRDAELLQDSGLTGAYVELHL